MKYIMAALFSVSVFLIGNTAAAHGPRHYEYRRYHRPHYGYGFYYGHPRYGYGYYGRWDYYPRRPHRDWRYR